jgi:hypothetical protein
MIDSVKVRMSVTGLNELFARDEIRRGLSNARFMDVRNTFLRYILKIDAGRVTIPTAGQGVLNPGHGIRGEDRAR